MDRYMEKRLTGLHEAGASIQLKHKVIIFVLSVLIIIILPCVHIALYYYIWAPGKPPVNKRKCSCDCFDTVFRGQYEWPPSAYKHVYFNSTSNTLKIWIVIVIGILGLYECVRKVLGLWWEGRLHIPMFLVLLSSIYPHYYGWWGIFNYLNEDYYPQWGHQIFFSLTEVISTCMVLHLCNKDSKLEPWKLLLIIVINSVHIIVGCLDQFIGNVVFREAKVFEAVRDLALLSPDIFHVLFPYFELQRLAARKRVNVIRLFYKEELMLSGIVLLLFSLLGKSL